MHTANFTLYLDGREMEKSPKSNTNSDFKSYEKWISALKRPSTFSPNRILYFVLDTLLQFHPQTFFTIDYIPLWTGKKGTGTNNAVRQALILQNEVTCQERLSSSGLALGQKNCIFPSYRYLYLIYFPLLCSCRNEVEDDIWNQRHRPSFFRTTKSI